MSWFNRKKKQETVEERSSTFDYLMYNSGASYSTSKAMLLSTVYRCVEVISDSVAQLPLEPYKMDTNGYKVKPIYFTDSYSSWQKGNIENTNKLVRQYIPKGTDISTVTDKRIAAIQAKINARPREKLNFYTPNEVFFKHYA